MNQKDGTVDGQGWLAKNRQTQSGPMPTKHGDVVLRHVNQRFDVWMVAADGAQQPDPDTLQEAWSRRDAEEIVREATDGTDATVYLVQGNGEWAVVSKPDA